MEYKVSPLTEKVWEKGLTDAPGLGLEIDEEVIAAHPPMEKTTARGGTVRGI